MVRVACLAQATFRGPLASPRPLVTWNLIHILLGLDLEEGGEYLCVDISAEIAAKFRRAWDMFDIFFAVARTVCRLHMDSSSLLTLPRDT